MTNFKECFGQVIMEDLKIILEDAQKEVDLILKQDKKAQQLKAAAKKEDSKMVDFIDYMYGKHDADLASIQKEYKIKQDKIVDMLMK